MAIQIRDAIASVHERKDLVYRVIARPVAQIVDKQGNIIMESMNEWETREVFKLLTGHPAYGLRNRFPSLKDVSTDCKHCGHGRNLHEHHRNEPNCLYIDSDGPCTCREFHV